MSILILEDVFIPRIVLLEIPNGFPYCNSHLILNELRHSLLYVIILYLHLHLFLYLLLNVVALPKPLFLFVQNCLRLVCKVNQTWFAFCFSSNAVSIVFAERSDIHCRGIITRDRKREECWRGATSSSDTDITAAHVTADCDMRNMVINASVTPAPITIAAHGGEHEFCIPNSWVVTL